MIITIIYEILEIAFLVYSHHTDCAAVAAAAAISILVFLCKYESQYESPILLCPQFISRLRAQQYRKMKSQECRTPKNNIGIGAQDASNRFKET